MVFIINYCIDYLQTCYLENLIAFAKFQLQKIIITMKNKDGTFKEDIQCIVEPTSNVGGIFISNIEAASNPLTLHKHAIGAVLSAVQGKNLSHLMPKHIEYLYIPAIDHQSFDISVYFDKACQFIKQESLRTNVLIHCMAGVSRSVTLVIAYLMSSRQISFLEAFAYVKSKRKIISPNESFVSQLKKLQIKILKQKTLQMAEHNFSGSNWFSKEKESLSTGSSWVSKQRSGQKTEEISSYDENLRYKIKKIFEIKNKARPVY